MSQGPEVPVACTLGVDDGRERLAAWKRLVETAGAGQVRLEGRLQVRFRDKAGVGDQLAELVAAERDCCSFVDWELVREPDAWSVEITGGGDALESIQLW